jgi:hypothetical protein
MGTKQGNTARKPASPKAVPANADQGAPKPAEIATGLAVQAMHLSELFRAIVRVNASEIHLGEDEDVDITLLAEIGKKMSEKLAEALDSFSFGLNGRAHHMAEAAEFAGVSHD